MSYCCLSILERNGMPSNYKKMKGLFGLYSDTSANEDNSFRNHIR